MPKLEQNSQRLRPNARFTDHDHQMLVQIPVEVGVNLLGHQKLEGPLSPIGRYGAQVPQDVPWDQIFWSKIFLIQPQNDMYL